ncbi:MAG: Nif3-like dinuclear metal center hexameric protein [Sulfurimonas sp.]|jgi:dinuclear metal center YbgI/SA1388 family protein|nr:Nif3-like dinuclear metal center hexameric protein [Sulfurimonas sp.]MBU1217169.1 Nif3-like dinuclear metal center hexameric protein [bacterium]MBU1433955.1 Nif3-like dinuclear metal center hexameric protein [bacterium]MBU1502937.1 Nif3-like dinuclear metal center hexameric protein [bacterium]MBU3938283.1 Nif3-like dinuclear metal center hexameric protein [bacterium]
MKISEIYKQLNELSPFELQESWDNSGLLLGDFSQEVKRVVLSIDVDEVLIESIENDTLLITHHPIIFGGLKQLEFSKYPANLIQKMIKKNISNIAMHTNFDQTHLNEYVANEILGYKIIKKDGFVATLEINEDFITFAKKVSAAFGLAHARCVKCNDYVKTAALTTGSGCSLMRSIEADCFLTGDVKYHDAMEAKSINLSLIDIGHYESERFFSQILAKHLKNLGLEVIISSSENPFTYI